MAFSRLGDKDVNRVSVIRHRYAQRPKKKMVFLVAMCRFILVERYPRT